MDAADSDAAVAPRPLLLFFHSNTSGPCRKAEAFLAQVLQRRHNHDTFDLRYVERDEAPALFAKLHVDRVPTLAVVEQGCVRARLERITGSAGLRSFLEPWLR
jgi:thioredoxin-like negative regulator of GroEL